MPPPGTSNGSKHRSTVHSKSQAIRIRDNSDSRHTHVHSSVSRKRFKDSVIDYTDLLDSLEIDRLNHEKFFIAVRKFRAQPRMRTLLTKSNLNGLKELSREFLQSVGSEYWIGGSRQENEGQQSDGFEEQHGRGDEDHYGDDENENGDEDDPMDVHDAEGERELPSRTMLNRGTKLRPSPEPDADPTSTTKYRNIRKVISSREITTKNRGDGDASPSDPSESSSSYEIHHNRNNHSKRSSALQELQRASEMARPQGEDQDLFRSAALGLRCRKTGGPSYTEAAHTINSNDFNVPENKKRRVACKEKEEAGHKPSRPCNKEDGKAQQDTTRLKHLLSASTGFQNTPTGDLNYSKFEQFKPKPQHKTHYFHWKHDSLKLIELLIPLFARMRKLISNIADSNNKADKDDDDFSEVEGEREIIENFVRKIRTERS